ncbi:abortive infection family protein (plasmid) [Paraburkholderia sp. DD10]|uniref:abortive infection family protein n=1 Tax=Paraburkholderia sp. DD10 TaxID=3409691 RepID=UPI003BA2FC62
MQLSEFTIRALGGMIAGDTDGWPYRSGPKLVAFFNRFGARDVYAQGFGPRRIFAADKLRGMNGQAVLRDIIRAALDPGEWLDRTDGATVHDAAAQLGRMLHHDGFGVVLDGNWYRVRDLADPVVSIGTPFAQASAMGELVIEEQFGKCREKIDAGDYPGAVTQAHALVLAVLLDVEAALDPAPPPHDGDIIRLCNRVRKLLNLDAARQDIADPLKQVLTGLSSIVAGLAGMHDRLSDARTVTCRPSRHHAKLAVNAAKALADFLFEARTSQAQRKPAVPTASAG